MLEEGKDTAWDIQTVGMTNVHPPKNLILRREGRNVGQIL